MTCFPDKSGSRGGNCFSYTLVRRHGKDHCNDLLLGRSWWCKFGVSKPEGEVGSGKAGNSSLIVDYTNYRPRYHSVSGKNELASHQYNAGSSKSVCCLHDSVAGGAQGSDRQSLTATTAAALACTRPSAYHSSINVFC